MLLCSVLPVKVIKQSFAIGVHNLKYFYSKYEDGNLIICKKWTWMLGLMREWMQVWMLTDADMEERPPSPSG